jgi:Putative addiction module component
MNKAELRKELHVYIETAEDSILQAIYEILRSTDDRDFQIPEEHKRIIRERLKAYEANPEDVISWEDIKAKYMKS